MKWLEDEICVLKNRDLTHQELHDLLPHRSVEAIRRKSYQHGLQRTMKSSGHLTDDEAQSIWDNPEFREMIEGHLLGDGCIDHKGHAFRLGTSNKDYANFVQDKLNTLSGKNNTASYHPPVKKMWKTGEYISRECWTVVCCCKGIFGQQRERWYPKGYKIVPRDLVLTPTMCNRWYCDDGCLVVMEKYGVYRIELCTDSFTLSEVKYLQQLLTTVGITTRIHLSKGKHRIITCGKEKFLRYAGAAPVDSFDYKWRLVNET